MECINLFRPKAIHLIETLFRYLNTRVISINRKLLSNGNHRIVRNTKDNYFETYFKYEFFFLWILEARGTTSLDQGSIHCEFRISIRERHHIGTFSLLIYVY